VAHEGQEISNPRSGQVMNFVELRPELLRIDSVHPHAPQGEPVHQHPKQKSSVELVSGCLVFEVDGERRELGPGDTLEVPAGVLHRFWNESGEEARSVQLFEPALDIASFFETFFALAQRDELDDKGMPSLLQTVVLVPEFGDEIRPASPPWGVLKALTTVLGPIARMRGYQARIAL
jgi:quercetin dioxygenase-like cupin family protein